MGKTLNIRLDRSTIKGNAVKTDAGFIFADSVLTRTGIFTYQNSDGSTRKELRLPEEVFNKVSMDSLKMIPATHGHPYSDGGIVTPSNVSRLQKGYTGENIRQDGNDLMGTVMVTDESTINSIADGNKDMSCGYTCDLEFTPGEYEGERYDAIQRNIKYNHIAVAIPKGRAGNAKINLDSLPEHLGIQILEKGAIMPNLKKVTLDGVEYEAEAPVLTALNTMKNDNADLVTELETATKERDTLQAKLDSANEELSKRNDSAELDNLVTKKVELIEKAKTVLDSVDSSLSAKEIMTAVITKVSPDVKLDEKSDDYIEARFDSTLEVLGTKEPNKKLKNEERNDAVVDHRQKMIDRMKNAYKGDE